MIEREFTARVDFDRRRVHGPDGLAADLLAACAAYEAAIADAGGIDLQLLGVGGDGHIGFNEPGSSLASRTRLKTLTGQTRVDNARFFDSIDAVPHHVLTQGVGTILEARHLVLVATGEAKADAVGRTVEGPVTAFFPASALQLHPHVSVVVDEAAAAAARAGRLLPPDLRRQTRLARACRASRTASDRAPARERPATACVAGERN